MKSSGLRGGRLWAMILALGFLFSPKMSMTIKEWEKAVGF